jgi:membrane protein implicated in regulation of membrane protease activity
MSTFARYMLFQIPGYSVFVLLAFWLWSRTGWPWWMLFVAAVCWIVKDVVLYPLVREAYSPKTPTGAERLVGAAGVVQAPLAPEGRIRIGGENWRARSCDGGRVAAGSGVVVIAADGLTLVVRADATRESSH